MHSQRFEGRGDNWESPCSGPFQGGTTWPMRTAHSQAYFQLNTLSKFSTPGFGSVPGNILTAVDKGMNDKLREELRWLNTHFLQLISKLWVKQLLSLAKSKKAKKKNKMERSDKQGHQNDKSFLHSIWHSVIFCTGLIFYIFSSTCNQKSARDGGKKQMSSSLARKSPKLRAWFLLIRRKRYLSISFSRA